LGTLLSIRTLRSFQTGVSYNACGARYRRSRATETLIPQTAALTAKPGLIDLHHHILPPFYLSEVRDLMLSSWKLNSRQESYLPTRVLEWSPQNALAEMDKNGVATSVVSISIPGIWFGGAQAARTSARKCNEYAAHLVQDHPGRFAFFASAPLPDTEGSLQEIAYALDVLKASGFIIYD